MYLVSVSTEVLLTNIPRGLQKAVNIVSDCRKMITTAFRSFYTRQPVRDFFSKNYRNFDIQQFLTGIETNVTLESQYSGSVSYNTLTEMFKDVAENAPIEKAELS